MDSSSDGSFAWTDASNDSYDSVSKVNEKMNKNHSEDESVSGKSYKRKLQEELFAHKMLENGDQEQIMRTKRKWSNGQEGNDDGKSPKKKKIKREQESDLDVSAGEKKRNSHDYDSCDESFLKLKVKDEQHFLPPHPTKAKKSKNKSLANLDILNEESHKSASKKSKIKTKELSISDDDKYVKSEEDTLNQLVLEEGEYNAITNKKKKKSKKRKNSAMSEENKPLNSDEEASKVPEERATPPEPAQEESLLSTPQKKINRKNLSLEDSTLDTEAPINNHQTRISERIEFEDECSDLETSQLVNSESAKSSKLKKFCKDNMYLKTLTSTLKEESAPTADDELWIIRCPKDVDVENFLDRDFTLEGKCKLKLNGQTYEGTVDYDTGHMAILSSEQNIFIIKSLSVKGHLNLRERIPKTHIQEDAALNINQTNFIPLPETKTRHPLIGYNYQKTIKLAASVSERLNATAPTPYKKSKRKRDRNLDSEQETNECPVGRPKAELGHTEQETNEWSMGWPKAKPEHTDDQLLQQTIPKKHKKKKHSEDAAPRKKKKTKHNLESAEAWESEQAIEENLFNF